MKTSPHLLPTIDELKELFSYDPETGIVTRRKSLASNALSGAVVGTLADKGYLRVRVGGGREVKLHHVAWALHYGEWPSALIDHRNGDPQDNRLANLRLATTCENMWNSKKPINNTSGFKGVSWDAKKGKWQAGITVFSRSIFLGRYDSKEDAAAAYAEASKVRHKEFGRLA